MSVHVSHHYHHQKPTSKHQQPEVQSTGLLSCTLTTRSFGIRIRYSTTSTTCILMSWLTCADEEESKCSAERVSTTDLVRAERHDIKRRSAHCVASVSSRGCTDDDEEGEYKGIGAIERRT